MSACPSHGETGVTVTTRPDGRTTRTIRVPEDVARKLESIRDRRLRDLRKTGPAPNMTIGDVVEYIVFRFDREMRWESS